MVAMAGRRVKQPTAELPSAADLDILRQLLPAWSGLHTETEFRDLLLEWFRLAARPEPPGEATQVGPELERIASSARALRDALREGRRGREVLADHLDALAEGDAELGIDAGLSWRMAELQAAAHYLAHVATRAERQWKRVRKGIRGERRHELQALEALCEIFQDASGCPATISKTEEGGYRGTWFEFAVAATRRAWPWRAKFPTELIMRAAKQLRGL
jgi:hypothetical protein